MSLLFFQFFVFNKLMFRLLVSQQSVRRKIKGRRFPPTNISRKCFTQTGGEADLEKKKKGKKSLASRETLLSASLLSWREKIFTSHKSSSSLFPSFSSPSLSPSLAHSPPVNCSSPNHLVWPFFFFLKTRSSARCPFAIVSSALHSAALWLP